MTAQFIPVVGDYYEFTVDGWQHERGTIAKVLRVAGILVWFDHPVHDELCLDIKEFNTTNLRYLGPKYFYNTISDKEVADAKNGLEKILGITSP